MFEFRNSLPVFSPAEQAAVESVLGRSLPESLVALLGRSNGGHPTKKIFLKDGLTYYFQYLYPISNRMEPNLRGEIEVSSYLTDFGLVPFALEGSGKVFAISDPVENILVCDRGGFRLLLAESLGVFLDRLEGPFEIAPDKGDERMGALANSFGPEVLRVYLSEGGSLDGKNSEGHTFAHLCAINGNVAMLAEIAKMGAGLGGTLHYAAKFNKRDVISFLLKNGRSVLERDGRGLLPIDYVKGNPPLRKHLLDLASEQADPREK
jgi:SMI1/KNR4 family protein SUKH-1/ankyrin repeat protein